MTPNENRGPAVEHVLATTARLNIDERLTRIKERQAGIVLAALDAGLEAANLDRSTRHLVRTTTARHLTIARTAA